MRPPNPSVHRAALAALLAIALPLAGCDEIEPLLGDATSEPSSSGSGPEDRSGAGDEAEGGEGDGTSESGAADDALEAEGEGEEAPAAGHDDGAADDGRAGSTVEGQGADAEAGDTERAEVEAQSASEAVEPGLLDAAAEAESEGLGVDMLSSTEAAEAERLVLEASLVTDALSAATDRDTVLASVADEGAVGAAAAERVGALADRPSYRVLYTQRAPDKEPGARAAEVAIYRYDTGEPLFNRVDLETGDVTSLEYPAGVPVPLVRGEIDEATLVALADPDVQGRLEAAGLDPALVGANGLLVGSTEEGNVCAESRCVRLFLTTLDQPVPEFGVIVDLHSLSIVEIEDMPGRNLNP